MLKLPHNPLIIIDGSSFLYRAYYGLRPLHTSKGVPVQATYGFCRSIKKLIDDLKPQRMALVWDSPGKTFRSEIYEAYKATRQKAPSDLHMQKEHIQEFASLIGLFQLAQSGFEADDLIASIVYEHQKTPVIIVSPDKDLQQLLGEHVIVFDPFKHEFITEEVFTNKNTFPPASLVLYHALLGDPSDNIPGVSGIGKKTATVLASEFKTLNNLYTHLDEVKPERIRTLLQTQEASARISLELFTLKTHTLSLTLDAFAFDASDWKNATPFFVKLEFKSFLKEVPALIPAEQQLSLEGHVAQKWTCNIVRTTQELAELIVLLKHKKAFAFDTETTGLSPYLDTMVGISCAATDEESFYIPVGHRNEENGAQLPLQKVTEELTLIFEDAGIKKYAHNSKFDRHVLDNIGIATKGEVFDTIIAASLLRGEWQKIGLKSLSVQYLQEPMKAFEQVVPKKKTFADILVQEGASYAAHDALQTYKLKKILADELEKNKKIAALFYDLEMPLCEVLFKMEQVGISLDPAVLKKIGTEIEAELEIITKKIETLLEVAHIKNTVKLNLNSPKQVEKLLFDELGLPASKKGAEGRRSTDQAVLEGLSKLHPIPGLIIRYRELFKLNSTYVLPLQEQISPLTKRIHTTFNQTDVTTGRLSSSEPNLQNIPAAAGYGIKIRGAFHAPKGSLFLSADYSQIDLRVLAHFSKDKNLRDAFLHDRDIHTQTAAEIFGCTLKEVTPKQRQVGKRINFSIIYGLTPYGLSRELDIAVSEAKSYIDAYFRQYPGVARWIEEVVEQAKKTGYVETWWGRRRYVSALHEKNRTLYEAARRAALNMPIQGTSSEVVKWAMLALDTALEKAKLKARMILQIHDEIIFEFEQEEEETLKKLVKKTMEGCIEWDIPLKVDLRVGENWEKITK